MPLRWAEVKDFDDLGNTMHAAASSRLLGCSAYPYKITPELRSDRIVYSARETASYLLDRGGDPSPHYLENYPSLEAAKAACERMEADGLEATKQHPGDDS